MNEAGLTWVISFYTTDTESRLLLEQVVEQRNCWNIPQ